MRALAILVALALSPGANALVIRHASMFDLCGGVALKKLPNAAGVTSLYAVCPNEAPTLLIDGCTPTAVTWNAAAMRYTVTCMGGAVAYLYIGPPR